ncbi:MAG: sensor histidine kinase [Bacteroidales bacterium]|nr:sensor histidine kinase [Bacteroidales bacterium]
MEEENDIKQISFTVDSGLIDRLGIELVGKAETAVSELVKNAYDADANQVTVEFYNTDSIGGTLIISDDGLGMTEAQLANGFMRISSTDKIHHPISERSGRIKAGKKGIGRFATQRLGEQLTIITQTLQSEKAIKVTIDWNKYLIDTDISSVFFPIEKIEKTKDEGTTLIISNLREKWATSSIEKIFSYVNVLFQPTYLSERSATNNIAVQDGSFLYTFKKDGVIIKNDIENFYDNALVVIEGYVGDDHKGIVSIDSQQLRTDVHEIIDVEYDDKNSGETITSFPALTNVRFKVYYFIYDKIKYRSISSNTYNNIKNLSDTISGIRLYRNGFRVLPYGEPTDDWVHINQRWSGDSGSTNIPFSTKHLFGFVELLDDDINNAIFQETSSREGLIENEAFKQLVNFVHSSLIIVKKRLTHLIKSNKNPRKKNDTDITISSEFRNKTNREAIDSYKNDINTAIDNNTTFNEKEKQQKKAEVADRVNQLKDLLKENEMLRVLASLGLNIGEFAHEVRTLQNYIYNNIYSLEPNISDDSAKGYLDNIINIFDELFSYTNYFGVAVSLNRDREKRPVDINKIVRQFVNTMQDGIQIEIEQLNYNVLTKPMHLSEWSSILSNLYSNSKKAIKRKGCQGKILIQIGIENNNTYMLFNDNGDGIKEKDKDYVFDAFFTTSRPVSYDSPSSEHLIGSGLGLKIIKDIVVENKGTINIVEPSDGYSTCFKITIPKNN